MGKQGLYSPVVRRIIPLILLIGITGFFLAIYYFIYLPQQRTAYNLRIFRILHEISSNFKLRVENYATVYSYNLANKRVTDSAIPVLDSIPYKDTAKINAAVISSFKGDALRIKSFTTGYQIKEDSISFFVDKKVVKKGKKHYFDTTQSFADILKPIIAVHTATFESVLLVKQKQNSIKKDTNRNAYFDTILYKSEHSDIANVNTDSLFHNKNIEAPVISDLEIEGSAYKMFLLPFKLTVSEGDTYVLAGIVRGETYKEQSQDMPVELLLSLCLILIVLLLVLPFLKIFFLSPEENITIKDVRIIIVAIFIIPVFIVLVCSATWLYSYRTEWTKAELRSLQDNVQHNFYTEINSVV